MDINKLDTERRRWLEGLARGFLHIGSELLLADGWFPPTALIVSLAQVRVIVLCNNRAAWNDRAQRALAMSRLRRRCRDGQLFALVMFVDSYPPTPSAGVGPGGRRRHGGADVAAPTKGTGEAIFATVLAAKGALTAVRPYKRPRKMPIDFGRARMLRAEVPGGPTVGN